jgi:hypothetical protein
MPISLALPPEIELSLRTDADREHLPVEEVAVRRLEEAELLRRIFAYFPIEETQEMRRLVRKREAGTLSAEETERLTALAHQREIKNAERLSDLLTLAQRRGVPHRRLMAELGIRPARMA